MPTSTSRKPSQLLASLAQSSLMNPASRSICQPRSPTTIPTNPAHPLHPSSRPTFCHTPLLDAPVTLLTHLSFAPTTNPSSTPPFLPATLLARLHLVPTTCLTPPLWPLSHLA